MSEASEHPDRAVVFDVQRFCVHDGPGIRTVVFFKGCHLSCVWCQNPEGKRHAPELAYHADRCLPGCRACLDACPEGALLDQIQARVNWQACTHCGRCVEPCPSAALDMVGLTRSGEDLLAEVLADAPFHASSGGGLTLSGGEPVLHGRFLAEFLPTAKAAGLHVTLETSGHYPFTLLEPLLDHLDLILFDVKAGGEARHLELVGQPTQTIDANLAEVLARARAGGPAVEVRMPIVPGLNDGDDALAGLLDRLRPLGVEAITLLPYNHLWEAKLGYLESERAPLGLRVASDDAGAIHRRVIDRLAAGGVAATMIRGRIQ
ncbi:glycyl-radical enzyme activating protein [Pseudenhygromyxa sp. WMMC2535]|uniref:glycyl-radical enzyme activating protein n=1 Tax=Pseudenhygromyxa sp. WMMC2535 TaxID=2712867 RepID=UPI001554B393|nr:glycyl-radical enzyme activating protein [Pseudenhygromyxa sp. WMMC2535]